MSDKKPVRSLDYRVHFSDEFDLAISSEGVRIQILQNDPDGFVSGLAGIQMPYQTALALASAIDKAIEFYEKDTGNEIPRPTVSLEMKEN
jgi:hypothetical protein